MITIIKLCNEYKELYKEYQEFLKINKLVENDILQVQFIFSTNLYNKNCLNYNPNLTYEECSMYNLTVDDNGEWILVDNDYGVIYVQYVSNKVIGFRCGEQCIKPKNCRFLNQRTIEKNKISDAHYQLLKKEHFFIEK